MTRRWLEIAVLTFGALFLAVVIFFFRPGRRPSRGAFGDPVPRVPPAAEAGQPTTVLKGFDYTETLRDRPLFRIQSERTVGFGPAAGLVPNMYALEKVALTVYPEQGAPVTVQADRANYDRRTNEARLEGNVRWTDERSVLAETTRIEFQPSARILEAPAAIHFSQGDFDVQARSGRYDVGKRELLLNGPLRGAAAGRGSGGLSELEAHAAVYRRAEGTIELSGSVSAISREGDHISCDRLTLKTDPQGQHLKWGRGEGHVRGTIRSATRLPVAGTSRGERRYAADSGAVIFGPEGEVTSLSLTGTPASVEEPERTVRAETIEMSFQSGRPLSARARGNVRIESGGNRAESQQASLWFSETGEVETLELEGQARIEGEGQSARAEKAVELPARGLWILSGDARSSATLERGGSRVSAARIELDEKRKGIRAEGNSRAVFTPAQSHEKAPTLVGDPSRPTFGKAERMVFDDGNRVATLSGGATLWQDASSLFGNDITVNDAERTLVAVGSTRTVLSSSPDPASREADRAPSVVTARRVIYREALASALFEGGVTLTRGAWRASAEKATVFLGSDRKIERIEMSGGVSMNDSAAGRTGQADRAADFPREEKTVLEGSPAQVFDAEGNKVSGATLTILGRGRSVEVTAPEGGKTETIHRTRGQ